MNAQVTKWENEGEKQLAILHDDNLLCANAHLNIPGNTSQIVVSDKYGLHNSSWLILSLQAHEHISSLIRFIAVFMGIVFTITIRFPGKTCHQNSISSLVDFCLFPRKAKDQWENGELKKSTVEKYDNFVHLVYVPSHGPKLHKALYLCRLCCWNTLGTVAILGSV